MSGEGDLLAAAVAAAGDAIITVDLAGLITSWSPAAEALLGHKSEHAVGQTLALIVPEQHRARHVAAFHAAMAGGNLANGGRPARVEALMRDGGTAVLGMSLGLVLDADGATAGAVAILRDASVGLVPFVKP